MDNGQDTKGDSGGSESQNPESIARSAIVRFIHLEQAQLLPGTEQWRVGSNSQRSLTCDELAGLIWAEHSTLPKQLFTVIIRRLAWTSRDQAQERIRINLDNKNGAEGATEELGRFVDLIKYENCSGHERDFYILAFRQLLWQVKRKLAQRTTDTDIMIVLSGPQGTGKSTSIRLLTDPLDFLCNQQATFDVFTQTFRHSVFERNYLIVFDEMEKAGAADIQTIKRIITSSHVQGRVMHSQQEMRYKRNASFIGATNLSLGAHLQDPTGMRRFAEVRFRTQKVTKAWLKEINGIDWALLWGCVTADESAPLQEAPQLVGEFQEKLVMPSEFDTWHEDCIEPSKDPEDSVQFHQIWASYVAWCDQYRTRPLKRTVFIRMFDDIHAFGRPKNKKVYKGLRVVEPAKASG